MGSLPPGSMLAVVAPLERTDAWLARPEWADSLSLAAINAPGLSVVSGPTEAITQFETFLHERDQSTRLLRTSHAFHSSMMDAILDDFTATVAEVPLSPPRIPYVSNLTGEWLADAQATDPAYYAQHLRHAVRFSDGLGEIMREIAPVFVEVGPGKTLLSLARRHTFNGHKSTALQSLPGPGAAQSESRVMVGTLGQLWRQGCTIDWKGFHDERQPLRVALPTYPFERLRCSVETEPETSPLSRSRGKRPVNDWFYAPSWICSFPAASTASRVETAGVCIVFRQDHSFHNRLTHLLRQAGHRVFEVFPGGGFSSNGTRFELNPEDPADYVHLLENLKQQGHIPTQVLHLWGLGVDDSGGRPQSAEDQAIELEFFPLVFLAQALGAQDVQDPVNIKVVVDGSVEVVDEGVTDPKTHWPWDPVSSYRRNSTTSTARASTSSCPSAMPPTRSGCSIS